ncbi:MAG TPA: zinc-finger domain-containing protein [Rhodanobacteraceae bacterium]|nr:zinc-finger domain-containing protein [Rhodanobacteraceae bacterium]
MATATSRVRVDNPREPANTARRYEVTRSDLPLSCPMPEMMLWNAHPRIYLPIEGDGGESLCPYCGALYVLRDGDGEPVQA